MPSAPDVHVTETGYKLSLPDGSRFQMSLQDMDAYLRANAPDITLPVLDGLITAAIVDNTHNGSLGDIIRAVIPRAALLQDNEDPDFTRFAAAAFSRHIHVMRSIEEYSPKPTPPSPGNLWNIPDVERALPNYPNAYKPILAPTPQHPIDPAAWARGFVQLVRLSPDAWRPFTKDHPRYWELGSIMYFVPNRRGYPTNKEIKNHTKANQLRYATTGIPADVIVAYHAFRNPLFATRPQ